MTKKLKKHKHKWFVRSLVMGKESDGYLWKERRYECRYCPKTYTRKWKMWKIPKVWRRLPISRIAQVIRETFVDEFIPSGKEWDEKMPIVITLRLRQFDAFWKEVPSIVRKKLYRHEPSK